MAQARNQGSERGKCDPKKSGGILRKEQQVRYGFVYEKVGCSEAMQVLEVSRSDYYEWVNAGMPSREAKDAVLLARIRQAERENHDNLGVKRMHAELNSQNEPKVSRWRVQRVMHENGIKARRSGLFKPQTTKADPNEAAYPNLLEQDFTVERRSQVWLADITYIRVGVKWAYLAVVLDLYDRKPIGWALVRSPSAELACMALRRALQRRKPAKGLIHHSDRGC